MAVLLAFVREPARPIAGVRVAPQALLLREFSGVIPPFTLFSLYHLSGSGPTTRNALFAGMLVLASLGLGRATGDWAQWIAVAIGVYSVATWAQSLRYRDLPLFKLTFGCPTFMLAMFGGAFVACFVGTLHLWAAPYAMRTLHLQPAKVGVALGLVAIGAAAFSVIFGGLITDRWKRRDRRAPIWIALIAVIGPVPFLFVLLQAKTLPVFVGAYAVMTLLGMSWAGSFAALVQDLVLPRMRGAAAAIFSLVISLTASGLGPYWAGKVSTMTGSLALGLYGDLVFVPIAVTLLVLAVRRLPRETAEHRRERAVAAGET